jgi:hypothetical protein
MHVQTAVILETLSLLFLVMFGVFPLPCATILSRFAVHVRFEHSSGYSMTLVDPHHHRPSWGHYRDGREDCVSVQAVRHCPPELFISDIYSLQTAPGIDLPTTIAAI